MPDIDNDADSTVPWPAGRPIRLALADDHRMFLEGLQRLLQDDFEIVGFASNGTELVELAIAEKPDLIVTDYSMPELTGLDAVEKIRAAGLDPRVVVLTMHLDPEYAAEAIARGVHAYVLKEAASEELTAAIQEVMEGRRWLSPALAMDVVGQARAKRSTNPLAGLTSRQREVLNLLVGGKIAKEIAKELKISGKTVEYHKYRMMGELGVSSSAELIKIAVQNGYTGT